MNFSQCLLVVLYEMRDVFLIPETSLILGISVLQQLLILHFVACLTEHSGSYTMCPASGSVVIQYSAFEKVKF